MIHIKQAMSLNVMPIVKKEFRQIKRDKRILGVLLFIPSLLLVMFGYALNFDVKNTPMAVYDEDRSIVSRSFLEKFFVTEHFNLYKQLENKKEIDELLDGEMVRVVLVVPHDFSKKIQRGEEARIQVIVDGSNSNAASITLGYVNTIIQQYSLNVISEAIIKSGRRQFQLPVDFRPRILYNPELRSAKFLVPGLIAFILMVTTVISTSLSIARERELGTIEQIMISPVKPIELILGKTLPYVLISVVATIAILFAGYIFFGVTIKGSIFLLSLVTFIFLVTGLGMGLLISSLAETQQLAFMIAAITSLLPTFILSGFIFPIRNMPIVIQGITYLLPARYFLVALRAIILKGAGIEAFWEQVLYLTIYAILMLGISSLKMKKVLA